MSSAYLNYWYFSRQSWFWLVLHPAWHFTWHTLHRSSMSRMTIYKLVPNVEQVHCSMSVSNCCFLTCIKFSQKTGKVVWYSYLFKKFSTVCLVNTIKGFSTVNEAGIVVFLEFSSFFYDPTDVINLNSGSSAFSKSSFYIWMFSFDVLLKPHLENFEHYFLLCEMSDCAVVWTFFALPFFGVWNENLPFLVLQTLLRFPTLSFPSNWLLRLLLGIEGLLYMNYHVEYSDKWKLYKNNSIQCKKCNNEM